MDTGRRRMMRMRRGMRFVAIVVLGVATAGCANHRMCGPIVWGTSMLVGGAAAGGGTAAGTDSTAAIGGAAAGGVVAGAILAPWLYHWFCEKEAVAAPPPVKPAPPAERKPIE